MARRGLRPARFDDLGLRRALSDRLLPLLVAAMAFLAALAVAGAVAASGLAVHWREGAEAAVTVQVPKPTDAAATGGGTRLDRVVTILRGTPGILSATPLDAGQLEDLLRPWLGDQRSTLSLPLPAVVEVKLADPATDLGAVTKALNDAVPGTLVESHGVWMQRLATLARSLQACAGLAVVMVALVAAAVIAVATRAGLAARRDAIEIVHGLGATDGYIAARFAGRTTMLATAGAGLGALAAMPVLMALAAMAAPFGTDMATSAGTAASGATAWAAAPWVQVIPQASSLAASLASLWRNLPPGLWLLLPALPAAAALIGWLTAQGTVRSWLRQLP
jgi:cell division transport system permease protein